MKDKKLKGELILFAAIVFTIVFLLHLGRVIYQLPITAGTWEVPMWFSYLAIIVTLILATLYWQEVIRK